MSKKTRHHGVMSMSPASGTGSGGAGGGGEDNSKLDKPKAPSGVAYPAVKMPSVDKNSSDLKDKSVLVDPMPVVLTIGTIMKLSTVVIIPMLGVISAGAYFFHKTNGHMEDPVVHLSRGERGQLETKIEARKARKELDKSIKRELTLQTRELKQDLGEQQTIQFKKLSTEIRLDQKRGLNQILEEVRETRKDLKRR